MRWISILIQLLCFLNSSLVNTAFRRTMWPSRLGQDDDAPKPPQTLTLGTIFPDRRLKYKNFKAVADIEIGKVYQKNNRGRYNFAKQYQIKQHIRYLRTYKPKPMDVLDLICDMLDNQVNTIMFFMTTETEMKYSELTAASQYLVNMAGHLGIPILAWNADNAGFDLDPSTLVLQMAPSVDHQVNAMLDFMKRYNWRHFAILTMKYIAGYDNFIQAVRREVDQRNDHQFTILDTVVLESADVASLKEEMGWIKTSSDTRIFLFYATTANSKPVFTAAHELGLTNREYMWFVTQVTIGSTVDTTFGLPDFPVGTIGTHFRTHEIDDLQQYAKIATDMWLHGFEEFYNYITKTHGNVSLETDSSCENQTDRWQYGETFFKFIAKQEARRVHPDMGIIRGAFTVTGQAKYASLTFLNWGQDAVWHSVGKWTPDHLEITDITWPGNSRSPPKGVPERFNLTVVTLEEAPFVISKELDAATNSCNRGVKCRVGDQLVDSNGTDIPAQYKCCSGLSIDILDSLSRDLNLGYELYRVNDGLWGGVDKNGTWNGLIQDLITQKADMCMTSLKITPKRSKVVAFSEPYMDTGIAIVVALREGSISTTAFLQPFDLQSWIMILVVFINGTALFLFIFEWMSPYGFNMKKRPPPGHRFSLFRAIWVMYTILFGASTPFDQPRGFVSRALANVWALFSLVFLASYTANLIKFMIAVDEWYDLKGIEDPRLQKPYNYEPAFRFSTIPYGSTEENIKKNYPQMYGYMRQYATRTVQEGVVQVKKGDLHAFVYDAKALQYKVGQDTDCRLLQVGNWFAMTGYGIAFPKGSKYIRRINRQILIYRENGDLERLERFWFMGDCKRQEQETEVSSNRLRIKQLSSTFIMLLIGMGLALLLLFLEQCYFSYVRQHLRKVDRCGICGLISISMGKSLSFTNAVIEATDAIRNYRCKNAVCDQQLCHLRHELSMAKIKMKYLEEQITKRNKLDPQRRNSSKEASRNTLALPNDSSPSSSSSPSEFNDGASVPLKYSDKIDDSERAHHDRTTKYSNDTTSGDMPLRSRQSPLLDFRKMNDSTPHGGDALRTLHKRTPAARTGPDNRDSNRNEVPDQIPSVPTKFRDGHYYQQVPGTDQDVYEIETVL